MAKLTGTVAPTRKTAGAIGDIYKDVKTGNEYKCTFSYRSDNDSDFDCKWQYLGNSGKVEKVEKPETTDTKIIDEDPVQKPKHKDYYSYSKKNK